MMMMMRKNELTKLRRCISIRFHQQVEVLSESSSPDTTSDVAAGIFYWGINAPDQVIIDHHACGDGDLVYFPLCHKRLHHKAKQNCDKTKPTKYWQQ